MATTPIDRPRRRPNGDPIIKRLGVPRDNWRDAYYGILVQSWPVFYLVLISIYLLVNCAFASLYWLRPGCIGEAHPGAWLDDFFFSFETISTVGYGVMHPITLYAHCVVVAEIMVGVLFVPLATGLTILKFARPTARVAFSRNVLITLQDGIPTLMFRLANIRSGQILETRINVTLLRMDTTVEGRTLRRLVDLKLVRDTNPMFVLTWTAMHRIDATSPFYGLDIAALPPGSIEIMAIMTGLDATTSATVHARHVYQVEDILVGHIFADIVFRQDDGTTAIDYRRLHTVIPDSAARP